MIETKIQMRFADVDMLGHVNNVNQQHYFDLGKSDFFRRVLGMKPVWKSEGLIMVSTRTDYRGQIRMEDPIVVTTCVDRIGHKSFTLRQQIPRSENRVHDGLGRIRFRTSGIDRNPCPLAREARFVSARTIRTRHERNLYHIRQGFRDRHISSPGSVPLCIALVRNHDYDIRPVG